MPRVDYGSVLHDENLSLNPSALSLNAMNSDATTRTEAPWPSLPWGATGPVRPTTFPKALGSVAAAA